MDSIHPTLSLVIPTYNRAGLIAATLESALAQVPPFFEIIVVDDGSSDHTSSILAPYADRVKLIHVENGGVQRARNLGVGAASGTFVALCDSDDLFAPGYVATMQNWLHLHPACNSVYCNFVTFDDDTVHADKFSTAPPGYFDGAVRTGAFWEEVPDLYERTLLFQPLFPSGSIIRRSLYLELNGYDSRFNGVGAEDYEYALRVVEAGGVALCTDAMIRIRRHGSNDSTDSVRQVRGEIQILEHALTHHRSAALYRESIIASIEARRLDVFNGAFARGKFDIAGQALDALITAPIDNKFRLKALITRLPSILRHPLWRLTQ